MEVLNQIAPDQTVRERFDDLFALRNLVYLDAVVRTTVILTNDNVLRYVDQTSGQIAGVRCTKRGVGQTFARAAGRNEVFQIFKPSR